MRNISPLLQQDAPYQFVEKAKVFLQVYGASNCKLIFSENVANSMQHQQNSNPPLSFSLFPSRGMFCFSTILIQPVSFCFNPLIIDKKKERACPGSICFHSNHCRYVEMSKPAALFFRRKLAYKRYCLAGSLSSLQYFQQSSPQSLAYSIQRHQTGIKHWS